MYCKSCVRGILFFVGFGLLSHVPTPLRNNSGGRKNDKKRSPCVYGAGSARLGSLPSRWCLLTLRDGLRQQQGSAEHQVQILHGWPFGLER